MGREGLLTSGQMASKAEGVAGAGPAEPADWKAGWLLDRLCLVGPFIGLLGLLLLGLRGPSGEDTPHPTALRCKQTSSRCERKRKTPCLKAGML